MIGVIHERIKSGRTTHPRAPGAVCIEGGLGRTLPCFLRASSMNSKAASKVWRISVRGVSDTWICRHWKSRRMSLAPAPTLPRCKKNPVGNLDVESLCCTNYEMVDDLLTHRITFASLPGM